MVNITTKHAFDGLNTSNNPFWGLIIDISNATNNLFIPGLLTSLFIILTWLFINRTQDIGKSMASSLYITTILTLIMYYAGKTTGYNVVSDLYTLGVLVTTALVTAGVYFNRSKI